MILCGDFNDTFESKTIQTLLGRAPGNSGGPELVPLFGRVPKGDQVTYNREPHRSMIDFLLCSPGMAKRYVHGSYQIRASREEESGSDHNPVYAQFLKKSPNPGAETSVSAVPVSTTP